MDPSLLAKYDGLRVPRYTSYPTAPQFSAAVGESHYAAWLQRLDPALALSLYLHVPFCDRLCWYCGCHTKIVARYEPVAAYVESILRELELVAERLPARMTVRHVHWGGGTPTMLRPADFTRVMTAIARHFDLDPAAELAVEIDPCTLDDAMAQALKDGGINRASLGVQDFDPEVQRRVNRVQPEAETAAAVERLNRVGIHDLNFDLMYGLPGQSVDTCALSAARAAALRPRRLAVFGYAHVPWMKRHQRLIDESALPTGVERWRQFAAIAGVLTGSGGFAAIGLDHFAVEDDPLTLAQRAGRLHRNFQGYTDDEAEVLIGIGASSIGACPDGYLQNATPSHDYAAAIAAGRLATVRGLVLSDDDRLRRAVIERLMCDLAVDIEREAARFGVDADRFESDLDRLQPLCADGVAVVDGRRVVVPEPARPLVRAVAAVFDRYLGRGPGRHAKAI